MTISNMPSPMKPMVLIKLGGGLIAPKDWTPETINEPVLKQLCAEIAKIWQTQSISLLVVAGSGNFGHTAVKKYGIATPFGIIKVQQIARKTGEAVVRGLKAFGLPSSLIAPHDIWYDGSPKSVTAALSDRLIPVLYGDVVQKKDHPAEIFSGEACVSMLIPALLANKYSVLRVIQAGKEPGVYDRERKIIPEINDTNWKSHKSGITAASPIDVTGGMLHKVEASLDIAEKYRIATYILDGTVRDRIYQCAIGKKVLATTISPS